MPVFKAQNAGNINPDPLVIDRSGQNAGRRVEIGMAKAEIGFERILEDGTRRDIYVAHNGGRYRFFAREKRFHQWAAVLEPDLEDWLGLLDCVQRRIARRKLMPEEEVRVRSEIARRFPTHEF
jgi:hypothetical protein